jgi:4-hydroxybenzoate polyprenyltransferase
LNLKASILLCRPTHWVKNGFVFAGVFFAQAWDQTPLLRDAFVAFVVFCLVSSVVYIFNDTLDLEADRKHPQKSLRPLAAGLIQPREAFFLGMVLCLLAFALALSRGPVLLGMTAAYLGLNILYTIWLKSCVLLDVFAIALGFILRMLAGTVAIGIPPSHWIIMCTLMLSLFLGFGKRYAEMSAGREYQREVLAHYSRTYLTLLLGITASCAILTYALYTISPRTLDAQGTTHLIYTLPVVIFGFFRYLYLVVQCGSGEDPARDIFSDVQILVGLAVYVMLAQLILAL